MPLARGFFYAIRIAVWIILHAARHWFIAWPLVVWPELVALSVLILIRPRVLGAWATWLGVMSGVEAFGVWIAFQKGWASTDDEPAVVVSAFVSSLAALPAATWIAAIAVDKLRPPGRITDTLPPP